MAWTHFLIETPFIVHRHIAGHATRVSHPKNIRSEVIQNGFKFKVCTLIFFPCKRFRKSDFQNVEFWNLKKDQHASTHVRDTYVTGTCGGLNFSMPTPIHTHSDISVETFEFLLQALVSIDVISARFKICVLPRVKAWGVGSKHVLHHVTSVNIVFVFVNGIVCEVLPRVKGKLKELEANMCHRTWRQLSAVCTFNRRRKMQSQTSEPAAGSKDKPKYP